MVRWIEISPTPMSSGILLTGGLCWLGGEAGCTRYLTCAGSEVAKLQGVSECQNIIVVANNGALDGKRGHVNASRGLAYLGNIRTSKWVGTGANSMKWLSLVPGSQVVGALGLGLVSCPPTGIGGA